MLLVAGGFVEHPARVGEEFVDGLGVRVGNNVVVGVVLEFLGDLAVRIVSAVDSYPAGIVDHAADRLFVIAQRPQQFAADLVVGQQLIDGRAPEVTMRQVARLQAVELERDVIALVDVVGVVGRAAGDVSFDQPVLVVVGVFDHLAAGEPVSLSRRIAKEPRFPPIHYSRPGPEFP